MIIRTPFADYRETSENRLGILDPPVSEDRDHIRGPRNAPLTLVEYGDYECPYCGRAHPIVNAVRQALGTRLRFVYRHFPLPIHPNAPVAAEAAESAGAQGHFWEMHDQLFAHQTALDPHSLVTYAAQIGVDQRRFVDDLTHHVFAPRVRHDFMSGVRSGVSGTPTFFINGLRYQGPWDFESLLGVLLEVDAKVAAPA
jgi:protein-disulfide isomerase